MQQADNEALRTELLDLVVGGASPHRAFQALGRSRSWYEVQRKTDRAWAALVDRARRGKGVTQPARMAAAGSFEEFCALYLGQRLFGHQRAWIDLIEGRAPVDLHPSMNFEQG